MMSQVLVCCPWEGLVEGAQELSIPTAVSVVTWATAGAAGSTWVPPGGVDKESEVNGHTLAH